MLLSGCGGKSSISSPGTYSGPDSSDDVASDSPARDDQPRTSSPLTYGGDREDASDPGAVPDEQESHSIDSARQTGASSIRDPAATTTEKSDRNANNRIYRLRIYDEDSASAVDDQIWRMFDLAEEYHGMGVIANREASWEEAQYYFEKSLRILANLDVEADSALTPEAVKYNSVLDNVVADYRVTLRSLGRLEENAAPSVLLERFGDLDRKLGLDSIRVFEEREQPITYDLPVVMNDRVKKSIIYFQTAAKDAFTKYLSRSKRYRWLFDEVLAEHGLPNDLIYLSLVESGYNPRAYSWARASGLWQFIASTGRLYGLNRNWWVDERRDPIKASHAAARFLKDLYKQFGHWELAMAAYNGGPRRVKNQIRRQKTRDFWRLRLKRQTMDYVPLIYAAAIIAKEPHKYGFTDIEFEDPVTWDVVTIDRCLDLKVVARELGCSYQELKDLNPELLRQYTPPNKKSYDLRIPVGHSSKFLAAYDEMPSPKETSWVKHKIRRGETVSTIASRYGVSQYAILAANNLSRRSKIYAGKSLIVPVPLDREYAASRKSNRSYEAEGNYYSVRSGDTMWDIARAFGTTVSALRRENYIERGSRIYVGQKLKIPTSAKRLKEKQSKSPLTYASRPPQSSGSSTSGEKKTYRVRAGDTLWDIARRFGTNTAALRRLNGLGRSSRIYPGQVLSVAGAADFVIHRVRRGDTLDKIARQYRTSIARIAAANGMTDPDNIRVGDQLKIYVK
jgi:membrane-bound lytic murein transglycosylase D